MGIEPYLVASSLEAVLAQRLVRVLCKKCRVEDDSARAQALLEKEPELKGARLWKAVGCRECRQTGYRGRHGIFEMMTLDYKIQQMILKSCSSGEIGEVARRLGMRSLRQDGWRLVREGVTTPDEVMRVAKDQVGESPAKP
jgi:type II secretory ATPase GspE/PulE/Tfp pilus assembly ATPase PilB-like protein